MIKGTLNELEIIAIKKVSRDRELQQAFGGNHPKREHRQLIGALGELAFSKAIGVYPRCSFLSNDEAKREYYDFKINNNTIEVKTVDSCTPSYTRLMVADTRASFTKINHADYYVLMGVGFNRAATFATYEIRGWISGRQLFKDEYYSKSENYKYKNEFTPSFPARVVQKDELNDFAGSLLQEITTINFGRTLR